MTPSGTSLPPSTSPAAPKVQGVLQPPSSSSPAMGRRKCVRRESGDCLFHPHPLAPQRQRGGAAWSVSRVMSLFHLSVLTCAVGTMADGVPGEGVMPCEHTGSAAVDGENVTGLLPGAVPRALVLAWLDCGCQQPEERRRWALGEGQRSAPWWQWTSLGTAG